MDGGIDRADFGITCGQIWAMKRPSEVPPVVDKPGFDAALVADRRPRRVDQIALGGQEGARPASRRCRNQAVAAQLSSSRCFSPNRRYRGRKAEIEQDFDRARDDVGRARAAWILKSARWSAEMRVAVVPYGGSPVRRSPGRRMDRWVFGLWAGILGLTVQMPEANRGAVFGGVAQGIDRGRPTMQ